MILICIIALILLFIGMTRSTPEWGMVYVAIALIILLITIVATPYDIEKNNEGFYIETIIEGKSVNS